MDDNKGVEAGNVCRRKREDKVRRKDNRALENVLKDINALPEEQKFQALIAKYSELYEDYRTSNVSLTISEKASTVLQKEKDQLSSEQSKLVLIRSRLEGLCRELQRQNKIIKEENIVKIREEEERRKEVAAKFQKTLSEVTTKVQENTETNMKLRDDNLNMASKIESLYKQFQERNEEQTKMEQQVEVEKQISEAKVQKMQLELKAEQELWNQERHMLLGKCKESEDCCSRLQKTVKALQESIELYSSRCQEYQSSMVKSTEIFNNFKLQMTKEMVSLEKEAIIWKQTSQKNAQTIMELSTDNKENAVKLETKEKKLEQLQKLCRQLQVDRSAYLKVLKQHGIKPPSQLLINENAKVKQPTNEERFQQIREELKLLEHRFNYKPVRLKTPDEPLDEASAEVLNVLDELVKRVENLNTNKK